MWGIPEIRPGFYLISLNPIRNYFFTNYNMEKKIMKICIFIYMTYSKSITFIEHYLTCELCVSWTELEGVSLRMFLNGAVVVAESSGNSVLTGNPLEIYWS